MRSRPRSPRRLPLAPLALLATLAASLGALGQPAVPYSPHPAGGPPPLPTGAPPGSLDPQVVAEIVRRYIPPIRRCYEQALRRDPALTARVNELRYTIRPDGHVGAVRVRMTPDHPEIARCIRGVLLRMVFPPFRDGPIEMSYPFNVDPA